MFLLANKPKDIFWIFAFLALYIGIPLLMILFDIVRNWIGRAPCPSCKSKRAPKIIYVQGINDYDTYWDTECRCGHFYGRELLAEKNAREKQAKKRYTRRSSRSSYSRSKSQNHSPQSQSSSTASQASYSTQNTSPPMPSHPVFSGTQSVTPSTSMAKPPAPLMKTKPKPVSSLPKLYKTVFQNFIVTYMHDALDFINQVILGKGKPREPQIQNLPLKTPLQSNISPVARPPVSATVTLKTQDSAIMPISTSTASPPISKPQEVDRFRPTEDPLDPPTPMEIIAEALREGSRKDLSTGSTDALPPTASSVPTKFQRASMPVVSVPIPTDTTTRGVVGPVEVKLIHRQMQSEMVKCLYEQEPVGRDVYIEVDGIDILVDDLIEVALIEIKTGTDCVFILREAIGQLLEYQFFAQKHFAGRKTRLIAVSPLLLDQKALLYLSHLKITYNLEIEYRQYIPGSFSFAI